MKKTILSLFALVALTLVACGPSKAYTAAADYMNSQMTKLDSVHTFDELVAFQTAFVEGGKEISNATNLSGEELSEKEDADLNALAAKLTEKMQSKVQELAPVMESESMEVTEEDTM